MSLLKAGLVNKQQRGARTVSVGCHRGVRHCRAANWKVLILKISMKPENHNFLDFLQITQTFPVASRSSLIKGPTAEAQAAFYCESAAKKN